MIPQLPPPDDLDLEAARSVRLNGSSNTVSETPAMPPNSPDEDDRFDFRTALSDSLDKGWVAAVRFLGDRDAAHDALQEAATRALAARHRFNPERPFYPWFYQILRNHCFDLLKKQQRIHPGRDRDAAESETVLFAQHSSPPDARLAETERQTAVLAAIEQLKPAMREIIELRHFQDLTYEEIASVLDCPQGTVMSRLYRARRALRDLLMEQPDFAAGKER